MSDKNEVDVVIDMSMHNYGVSLPGHKVEGDAGASIEREKEWRSFLELISTIAQYLPMHMDAYISYAKHQIETTQSKLSYAEDGHIYVLAACIKSTSLSQEVKEKLLRACAKFSLGAKNAQDEDDVALVYSDFFYSSTEKTLQDILREEKIVFKQSTSFEKKEVKQEVKQSVEEKEVPQIVIKKSEPIHVQTDAQVSREQQVQKQKTSKTSKKPRQKGPLTILQESLENRKNIIVAPQRSTKVKGHKIVYLMDRSVADIKSAIESILDAKYFTADISLKKSAVIVKNIRPSGMDKKSKNQSA